MANAKEHKEKNRNKEKNQKWITDMMASNITVESGDKHPYKQRDEQIQSWDPYALKFTHIKL